MEENKVVPQKILIVDDNNETIEMLKTMVELTEYEAITADNGAEAIKKAVSEKPALIILDLMMPIMDGITALEELEKDETTKTIPVIISSGKFDDKKIESINKMSNVKGFLTKPYDCQGLIRIIKEILAQ